MLYKKINLTKRYKNIALLCKISRPLLFSNRKCILYCELFSKPPNKNVLTGDSELKFTEVKAFYPCGKMSPSPIGFLTLRLFTDQARPTLQMSCPGWIVGFSIMMEFIYWNNCTTWKPLSTVSLVEGRKVIFLSDIHSFNQIDRLIKGLFKQIVRIFQFSSLASDSQYSQSGPLKKKLCCNSLNKGIKNLNIPFKQLT